MIRKFAILAAILLPAIMSAITTAVGANVRQECVSIKGAIHMFSQHYGRLPASKGDPEKTENPTRILKALIGNETTVIMRVINRSNN